MRPWLLANACWFIMLGSVTFAGKAGPARTQWISSPAWHRVGLEARTAAAMAFDERRGRLVLFGGGNDPATWAWDGSNWTQLASTIAASSMGTISMAYDSRRGRMVMFAGNEFGASALWEWDGAAWQPSTAAMPSKFREQAMAFDTQRGRTLMFGGSRGIYQHDLTFAPTALWAWDGVAWTQWLGPVAINQALKLTGAYNSIRGRIVAVGAYDGKTTDTWWEWDGSLWHQRHGTTAPAERTNAAMVYDRQRQRMVLYGGMSMSSPQQPLKETWEFDGANWMLRTTSVSPPVTVTPLLAYDAVRQRTVYYVLAAVPETWEWDGTAWRKLNTAVSPRVTHAAMAFDPVRHQTILFGGALNGTGSYLNEIWAWDGATWTKLSPAHAPSPRIMAAMAWDEARRRLVLFGGANASFQCFNDVWEWDGADWTQVSISPLPSARGGAVMAYDSARRRFVMFGGYTYMDMGHTLIMDLLDTWELLFPVPAESATREWRGYQ